MPDAARFDKHPRFLVRQAEPFNGGPPPDLLRHSPITPNGLFFVRNHGDVPALDARRHRLIVEGAVERPLELSLADLAAFPKTNVIATLQCAGHRRQELARRQPIPHELPWGAEAVSTAVWTGVRLADLLAAARPTPVALHAACEGRDQTERQGRRISFGGSIPLAKAAAPEVLVAYEMNGVPLPAVHGFPLRLVVPGWIGARSVKWLHRIVLQAEPTDNYFQAVAYRLFPATAGPENVVWSDGAMLGEQSVNACFTAPEPGARRPAGRVHCEGVAVAGGGRQVERVELSHDGGRSWLQARLEPAPSAWSWRLWSADLELAGGRQELVVRAWDSAAQTQPSTVDQVWNFKGYMNNAWHRIELEVG